MKPDKPIILKVGGQGAYVNVNNCVSFAVLRNFAHQRLKDAFVISEEDKKPGPNDYETYHTDTFVFYFIGGSELPFKVGENMTQEEFDALASVLEDISYHERKPVSDQVTEGTT